MRAEIHAKFSGRCAYCGKDITVKQMQVDHIEPILRGRPKNEKQLADKKRLESIDNKNPACARCNRYKATYSIEQLREQIGKQAERLIRDSSAFRFALDFGQVRLVNCPVKFHFEKY